VLHECGSPQQSLREQLRTTFPKRDCHLARWPVVLAYFTLLRSLGLFMKQQPSSRQISNSDKPVSHLASSPAFNDLQLAIEYVAPDTLKMSARNARTHSKAQVRQIAASIRAFGFASPVVVDETGEIIAGHGRIQAAMSLDISSVPVVRLEHLDDAQKRALRIADNRLAELAGWDPKILALEFKDLLSIDLKLNLSFDLAVTGFAPAEIDRMIDQTTEAAAAEKDDQLPDLDPMVPRVSQLGDIWRLGEHVIVCGDARERATFETLLGDERASMGIHDSPYNVSIAGHVSGSGKHDEFLMATGELSEAEFTSFLEAFLTHAARFSKPGAIQWAFMDWRHIGELMRAGGAAGLDLINLAVWDKGAGAMGSLLRSQHELVFMFKKPGAPHINNIQLGKFGRNRTNVWAFPGAAGLRKELKLHPTPKPVSLVAEAIKDVSNRGDLVLDAFSGSGTTIIACARTGRRARVIELAPRYVDVAVERWQRWSGCQAIHAEINASFEELRGRRSSELASSRAGGPAEPAMTARVVSAAPASADVPLAPRRVRARMSPEGGR
jgi:DNA modification methylase